MPKKNKKNSANTEEQDKKSHFLLNFLITLLIIIIWLVLFGVLIKFDVGGLGSTLRPLLVDIPVVNKILPDVSDEELADELDYPYKNLTDAINRIKELEAELASINDNMTDSDATIAKLQAEIDRLSVFEENQLEFEERVKEFDENVVFANEAPDIENYKQYYEEIDPTNAEEIYAQVIKQLQYDAQIQEKAEIFSKMKPKAAAAILAEMTADTESVAKILTTMSSSKSSLILAEMDTTVAAKITKKMLDLDEELQQQ